MMTILAVLAVAATVMAALADMVVERFYIAHHMVYGTYNADRRKVEQDR